MAKRIRALSKDIKTDDKSELISFDAWFMQQVHAKRFARWQQESVRAYMKHHGLSENEEKEKYDRVIKRF